VLESYFLKKEGKKDHVSQYLSSLKRDGYVIIPNLLSEEYLSEVRATLKPYVGKGKMAQKGRNNFEGFKTNRVYALLGKSRIFDKLVLNDKVLSLLDATLLKNYLLTAFHTINILPNETPQPFHYDDQYINIPRPRPPTALSTMWAIGESGFTAENGGTVVIPGSHKWKRMPTEEDVAKYARPVVMSAGSVVVFYSTLWHGGGRNVTKIPRLAITAQYCEPWVRPMENQMLVVPREEVLKLDPRLVSLIGYNIHPPFVGHVDGRHPLKTLEEDQKLSSKL